MKPGDTIMSPKGRRGGSSTSTTTTGSVETSSSAHAVATAAGAASLKSPTTSMRTPTGGHHHRKHHQLNSLRSASARHLLFGGGGLYKDQQQEGTEGGGSGGGDPNASNGGSSGPGGALLRDEIIQRTPSQRLPGKSLDESSAITATAAMDALESAAKEALKSDLLDTSDNSDHDHDHDSVAVVGDDEDDHHADQQQQQQQQQQQGNTEAEEEQQEGRGHTSSNDDEELNNNNNNSSRNEENSSKNNKNNNDQHHAENEQDEDNAGAATKHGIGREWKEQGDGDVDYDNRNEDTQQQAQQPPPSSRALPPTTTMMMPPPTNLRRTSTTETATLKWATATAATAAGVVSEFPIRPSSAIDGNSERRNSTGRRTQSGNALSALMDSTGTGTEAGGGGSSVKVPVSSASAHGGYSSLGYMAAYNASANITAGGGSAGTNATTANGNAGNGGGGGVGGTNNNNNNGISPRKGSMRQQKVRIYDDPGTTQGYLAVPLLEMEHLPRGGLSIETAAVGRVQFGIPPETIKDSMRLGLDVPRVYIVPMERFCREMGPALGINLAEFEFPAYFNWFVRKKKCILVVDSDEAERNIRKVFEETLLGPARFRDYRCPVENDDEDFGPEFPRDARPNFFREFQHFRECEKTDEYDELTTDMLLEFQHFKDGNSQTSCGELVNSMIGIPMPTLESCSDFDTDNISTENNNKNNNNKSYQENSIEIHPPTVSAIGVVGVGVCNGGSSGSITGTTISGGGGSTLVNTACGSPLRDSARSSGRTVRNILGSSPSHHRPKSPPPRTGQNNNKSKTTNLSSLTESRGHSSNPKLLSLDEHFRRAATTATKRVGSNRGSIDDITVSFADVPDAATAPINPENNNNSGHNNNNSNTNNNNSYNNHNNSSSKKECSLLGSFVNSSNSMFSGASGGSIDGDGNSSNGEKRRWMFSRVKWLSEVATVWPMDATYEQIQNRTVPRVEIFKMPGGAEYIIHDVDSNNVIIGKARFSGTVRVPDELAVEGFLAPTSSSTYRQQNTTTNAADGQYPDDSSTSINIIPEGLDEHDEDDDDDDDDDIGLQLSKRGGICNGSNGNCIRKNGIGCNSAGCTFHPPSFGVTVLGNSHGFDKNGSTSGYVLWVNGRGIMIDPPPYSSATLEREGIRPQMIFGVIITHCHADHDAGAFQKILTSSRISIITSPTIYESFIRKYSALSGLSPNLLRHSHRFRPAIIGQALHFQGITFHFNYTLHTIPCLAFKVEWRGRSMVFTGDHLNLPPLIDELQQKGVLSKGRADSLKQLPLQECDALLHEAGAPPIHTPLRVLQDLPERVKERLYVVHTSALPPDCGLRVAPTGTAGTIRLDQVTPPSTESDGNNCDTVHNGSNHDQRNVVTGDAAMFDATTLSDGTNKNLTVFGDYAVPTVSTAKALSSDVAPLVFLRPTCVSDAWFILNLLSNVPFFSSLSYAYTMEVLEIANVGVFCAGDVIVPATRRCEVLCVVWEGACIESVPEGEETSRRGSGRASSSPTIWHAGDWTGPVALQPDVGRAADYVARQGLRDVVAYAAEGVKVIILQMKELEKILKRGSKHYRQYLSLQEKYREMENDSDEEEGTDVSGSAFFYHVLVIIKFNSVLANLTAHQKRSLESIAVGPRVFEPDSILWRVGDRCDYAFLIVDGSVSFGHAPVPNRKIAPMAAASFRRASLHSLVESDNGKMLEVDRQLQDVSQDSEYARLEAYLSMRAQRMDGGNGNTHTNLSEKDRRAQNSRDRYANKVLARLYASRRFTSGIIFTSGCFLCDASRMVTGELVHDQGESSVVQPLHSSTMVTGPSGCVVWVFSRTSFVPFLEANPGLLLSLLGTQAVI